MRGASWSYLRGSRSGSYLAILYALGRAGFEGLSTSELSEATGILRNGLRRCIGNMNGSGRYPRIASTGRRGRSEARYWLELHLPSGPTP